MHNRSKVGPLFLSSGCLIGVLVYWAIDEQTQTAVIPNTLPLTLKTVLSIQVEMLQQKKDKKGSKYRKLYVKGAN